MARRKTGQASGRQQRRSTSRKGSTGRSLPGWLWGVGGLGIGLGVALLVHWHYTGGGPQQLSELMAPPSPQQQGAGRDTTGDSGTPPQGGGDTTAKQDKPRFEFYRLLPEQKVEVPGGDQERQQQAADRTAEPGDTGETTRQRSASADTGESTASKSADSNRRYLLQAGSFRGHDDADRLKARLALLGIEANIQRVELSGGELWHRVRVGPFNDLDRVNTVRRRLKENGIETVLLKRSG
ncbi:Cell division protein FtsN [wastewater metagenome]|uniref:Cell division protein FtsN n=2 Tax=unclassified sequences TaxID=12908 RepID=A0A5B8R811_9ZZZZ|nr:SPOR domain-containing protein [Arhodomonas aquaeolei]MCS4505912.1 SPOR domain-containing protein [Arhodomonas aquaeolei]QEA04820.1 cell division protein FtsN [uncultured organism]